MLFVLAHHLMLMSHIIQCHSQWISVSDPSLVRALHYTASATYGDSIFLMGGLRSAQLQEYKISPNSMIDHGTNALSQNTWSYGVFYSQWLDKLYVLPQDSLNVFVYNLASINFPDDVLVVSMIPLDTIPIETGHCLAASQDFVFITGGYQVANVLSILTISSNTWSNGPTIQYMRLDHNCVVAHDYLYLIGNTLENERISIDNIQNKQWISIGSLTERVRLPGTAVFKDIIWVVGGRIISADGGYLPCDKVWNIDTSSGSVQLLSERLPHAISEKSGTILIANNVLYAFGGEDRFQLHWMRYVPKETTEAPTTKPTAKPTPSPTKIPTLNPSKTPTLSPIREPTPIPTVKPTNNPTNKPTSLPTQQPTVIVTVDHETQPSYSPVAYRPSVDPIAYHTSSTETEDIDHIDPNSSDISAMTAKERAIYMMALLGVCCCCCVFFLCFGYFKKKQKKMRYSESIDEANIDLDEDIQMKHLTFIISSPHNTIQSPDFIMHTLVDDGEEEDNPNEIPAEDNTQAPVPLLKLQSGTSQHTSSNPLLINSQSTPDNWHLEDDEEPILDDEHTYTTGE
eukprot:308587_1